MSTQIWMFNTSEIKRCIQCKGPNFENKSTIIRKYIVKFSF